MQLAEVYSLSSFKSKQLIEDGKHYVSMGDFDQAIEIFQKSIEVEPQAEAYTYLAWVMSLKEQTDEAIALCKKAIELDPEFGNPFNDIGSYLIQKNKYEEAIPWLEKAKKALRYEPKHFPYLNLGRLYVALGEIDKAIQEFQMALEIVPGHRETENVLEQLLQLRKPKHNA